MSNEILFYIGKLNAKDLKLNVQLFDNEQNYKKVKKMAGYNWMKNQLDKRFSFKDIENELGAMD